MPAKKDTDPLLFILPDRNVTVPTWGYILGQFTELCTSLKNSADASTSALDRIEDRIDYWINKQR